MRKHEDSRTRASRVHAADRVAGSLARGRSESRDTAGRYRGVAVARGFHGQPWPAARGAPDDHYHAGDLWIICALRFKERWNEQWLPRRFTWLFFYDEAVGLAQGHRPCGECRHARYTAYRDAWAYANPGRLAPSARDMNRQLHVERIVRGTHRRRLHPMPWRGLPDGAFVLHARGVPHAVLGSELVEWTRDGYGAAVDPPGPRRGNRDNAAIFGLGPASRLQGADRPHGLRLTASACVGFSTDFRASQPAVVRLRHQLPALVSMAARASVAWG